MEESQEKGLQEDPGQDFLENEIKIYKQRTLKTEVNEVSY